MIPKRKLGEKGAISYAVVFIVFALVLLLFFTLIGPMSQKINTESYKSAQSTIESAIVSANGIHDENVKASLLGIFQDEKDSFVQQTEVTGKFITYGWFFIILVVLFGLFLSVRRNVEAGGGVA